MRRAAKVDGNQAEIVDALRKLGFTVLLLHQVGHGCPDLCIGKHGRNHLLEIKMPGEDLTREEKRFYETWGGQVDVVDSIDAILEIVGSG